MDYIITTEQLTKKYKNFTSVNSVSLHIRKGSIYGFLGPNGAGKSTTMKMLLGLTAPTKGSFTIDGKHFPNDRIAILKEIGSFIEAPSFYANLTGRENLDIIRRILGLSKADVEDALELVGLRRAHHLVFHADHAAHRLRLYSVHQLVWREDDRGADRPDHGRTDQPALLCDEHPDEPDDALHGLCHGHAVRRGGAAHRGGARGAAGHHQPGKRGQDREGRFR